MDIKVISDIAMSQAVWSILCISLVIYTIKKSDSREEKLMKHLERSNESQEKTTTALVGINENLTKLENRIDNIEKSTLDKRK